MNINKITIRKLDEDNISVQVPTHLRLDEEIRRIPGSRWSSVLQRWNFPSGEETLAALRKVFTGLEIEIDTSVTNPVKQNPKAYQAKLEEFRLKMEDRKYSPQTVKSYLHYLGDILKFTASTDGALTSKDVENYLHELEVTRESKPSTRNIVLSSLKFYFENVQHLPMDAKVNRPRRVQKLPSVLSRQEVMRLVNAPDNLKHRALLVLAYSGGLRVSEVSRLRTLDVDCGAKMIRVRNGRADKERYTLLSDLGVGVVQDYLRLYEPGEWLFEGQKKNQPVTVRAIQRVFELACEKAGLGGTVSIHCLRHSFAAHLLEDGVDIKYIQQLLGHENNRSTRVYHRITDPGKVRTRRSRKSANQDAKV